jgi:peroxiredoxin
VNHADTRGRDYPLIREKYAFLLGLAPVVLGETVTQTAYFGGLKADVITSCCGSLFSAAAPGVASELAALPSPLTKIAFYAVVAGLLATGAWYRRRASGGYVVAGLSVLAFLTSLAALLSFISLYIYELPTHHCPFCRQEIEALEWLFAQYRDRGFTPVSVNVGETKAVAAEFSRARKVTYPILLDPDRATARLYGVTGLPATFMLDRAGIVGVKVLGGMDREGLRRVLARMLGT